MLPGGLLSSGPATYKRPGQQAAIGKARLKIFISTDKWLLCPEIQTSWNKSTLL
jgi:hypothetical protein